MQVLHKLTTELVRQYDVICIEDLDVKAMEKVRYMAKRVADASFGEFRRQIVYKAERYGKQVSIVDKAYPSTQICNDCGYQHPGTKKMSVRKWVCPVCGVTHDRDINATKNILKEGLRLLIQTEST